MFHRAFFNLIIDKTPIHALSFNTTLVYRAEFIKIHKNI